MTASRPRATRNHGQPIEDGGASGSRRRSAWSLELVLVVGIPVATVVAGLFTVWLASQEAFHPGAVRTDRFGYIVETQP